MLVQPSLLPDTKPLVHSAGQIHKPDHFAIVKRLINEANNPVEREEKKEKLDYEGTKRTGGCERPIQLSGELRHVDSNGEFTTSHTNTYVNCKTRRATKCEPCSLIYKHDARHLITAGLKGGKGIAGDVVFRPALFITFTAPSFGAVHSANSHKCLPRRKPETCEHGREIACWRSHDKDDPFVGQPICPDCYDYRAAILWNNAVGNLWRITRINLDRALAKVLQARIKALTGKKIQRAALKKNFSTQYVKVTEFQKRGMVHFHIALRLDGKRRGRPAPFSIEELTKALEEVTKKAFVDDAEARKQRQAIGNELKGFREKQNLSEDQVAQRMGFSKRHLQRFERGLRTPTVKQAHAFFAALKIEPNDQATFLSILKRFYQDLPNNRITWGEQLDIDILPAEEPEEERNEVEKPNSEQKRIPSRKKTARYLAKYATKSSDDDGKLDSRFKDENELRFLNVNDHFATLVRTSWKLARAYEDAKLDAWSHQLGYRGHFLTKSRGWSTTFKALRQVRIEHQEAIRQASWDAMNPETRQVVIAKWQFAGTGFRTGTDDAIAEAVRNKPRTNRAA